MSTKSTLELFNKHKSILRTIYKHRAIRNRIQLNVNKIKTSENPKIKSKLRNAKRHLRNANIRLGYAERKLMKNLHDLVPKPNIKTLGSRKHAGTVRIGYRVDWPIQAKGETVELIEFLVSRW